MLHLDLRPGDVVFALGLLHHPRILDFIAECVDAWSVEVSPVGIGLLTRRASGAGMFICDGSSVRGRWISNDLLRLDDDRVIDSKGLFHSVD